MNTNQAELTNLIQAEIRQNNHQMLEAMQKMLDNSVSQLKRSASESAESQLQEIKKLKYNEPHKFKKRANEDQFKFNSKVIDTMNDAATALECKDYTRTKDEITKGELMMAERQKHILLADKSEFGWATVNEYKKHELAADSEKRIYKSEQQDLFKGGIWQNMFEQQNFELTSLAQNTEKTVIVARAPSTVSVYSRSLNKWKEFADKYNFARYFPAEPG